MESSNNISDDSDSSTFSHNNDELQQSHQGQRKRNLCKERIKESNKKNPQLCSTSISPSTTTSKTLSTTSENSLHSFLTSLDSCFNFIFFGIPHSIREEHNTDESNINNHQSNDNYGTVGKNICNVHAHYNSLSDHEQRINLLKARAQLLNLSESTTDAEDEIENETNTKQLVDLSSIHTVHCEQEGIWDCGITCLFMFIRILNNINESCASPIETASLSTKLNELERIQKKWMMEQLHTKSIWTIDLVMLVERIFHGNVNQRQTCRDNSTCINDQTSHHNGTRITETKDFFFPTSTPIVQEINSAITAGDDMIRTTTNTMTPQMVKYMYCSNNLGVDVSYQNFKYYKNAFYEDEKRVNELFFKAYEQNLPFVKVSYLDLDFVVDIVKRKNCIAIVLLDYSVFSESMMDITNSATCTTNDNISSSISRTNCNGATSTTDNKGRSISNKRTGVKKDTTKTDFTGHYVILSGISTNERHIAEAEGRIKSCQSNSENNCKSYSQSKKFRDKLHNDISSSSSFSNDYCMIIHNPGCSSPVTFVSKDIFERSWRATGTDCDILFLAVHNTK